MLSPREMAAMKARLPAGLLFGGFASTWLTPKKEAALKQAAFAKFCNQPLKPPKPRRSVADWQEKLDHLTRRYWQQDADAGVAAHEAAHAAAVHYFRGQLSRVSIDADSESGYTDFRAAGLDDLDLQTISLIGAVAQARVTGQYEICSDDDWKLCRDTFASDPDIRRAEVAAAEGRATALANRYWQAIGSLAAELILQRVVTGAEASDVLERNGMPPR